MYLNKLIYYNKNISALLLLKIFNILLIAEPIIKKKHIKT
jgi:hypothetical protein